MSKLLSLAVASILFTAGSAAAQNITTTDVRGSGNTVIVSGNGGAVQIMTKNVGPGNKVLVFKNGKLVVPTNVSYASKANKFWSHKQWDTELRLMLFHCPKTQLWFRYHADRDVYSPALEYYEREARRLEREAQQALEDVDRLLDQLDRVLP